MNVDDMLANIDAQLAELESEEQTILSSLSDVIYIKDENYDALNSLLEKYRESRDPKYLSEFIKLLSNVDNIDIDKMLLSNLKSSNVLSVIIDSGMSIPYNLYSKLIQSKEIVKLLIDKKFKSPFTVATEKEYLTEIDGMTLLEHLIKNDMFEHYHISRIKNSRIIIDLLVKYNQKIKLCNISTELLFETLDNELVIDYLLKNKLLDRERVKNITNNVQIYEYLVKYKNYELLKYLHPNILVEQIDDKYILDCLFEIGVTPEITYLYNQKLFDLLLERQRYDLLENTPKHLLEKNIPDETKTLGEFLLERSIVPKQYVDEVSYGRDEAKRCLDLLVKYNKLSSLEEMSLDDKLLIKYYDNETLFETLIKNNIVPQIYRYDRIEFVEILMKYNRYEELENCNDQCMLSELSNGKKVIDELLERNLDIKRVNISNSEIINKIIEHKRVDLYGRIKTKGLLQLYDLQRTYLDVILEESKTNNSISITNLIEDASYPYEIATAHIIYAKHDLHMFLKRLTKEDLLKNQDGKRFIDALLELDPELTISKIIPQNVKEDMEIAMIIKFHGVSQKEIKFDSLVSSLEKEYLDGRKDRLESLPLTSEQETLYNQLVNTMSDDLSDKNILSALFASYRYLLATNSPYANEIYHIINIKQNKQKFAYRTTDDGAYYIGFHNTVYMDDTNIDTLNHETGHALFNNLTNKQIPEGFADIIQKLRNDPSFLEKTAEYSRRFYELKEMVINQVEEIYMPKYDESVTEEKRKEIEQYLSTLTSKQRDIYVSRGYSEELIDLIFSKTFTVDQYLEQDRRVKKEELVDLILRTEYGHLTAIGDYLDGIHVGRLKGGILKDKDNNNILPGYGHGIEYYSRGNEWIFDEMIANFSEISKSEKSEEGLKELKEYIGEELFNLLQAYYTKEILQSKKFTQEQSITL